jgi:hypothetical protein
MRVPLYAISARGLGHISTPHLVQLPHSLRPEPRRTETDLDTLAEIVINGRQIKNVIKTARLIAMRKNAPLSMEHIQTVMSVMENIHK